MNFEVIEDRLLIKPLKEENEGGILVPDSIKDNFTEGEVIKAGGSSTIQTGIIVFYKYGSGVDLSIDGNKYKLIREEDAVATK